ncbi:MAG: type I restriction endonuclease subunit R [Limnochordia bacterium]|nr:type I restriction endonuclease subunit R [Bacillota bacterium]
MRPEYDELNISQVPALEVLGELGYTYILPAQAVKMRGSLYDVLLKDVLAQKLVEINDYEYKGKRYKFNPKNIARALKDLDEPLTDGLVRTNEKIYDALMLGRSYEEDLPDGSRKSFSLQFVDWEDPDNNVFHVTEEFKVQREDGRGNLRVDLVLFVNGIPFAVIECKRSSVGISQGISQMLRNQGKDYAPHLFKYSQILMATNKNKTKYATCNTPKRFWSIWKEEDEEWLQAQLSKVVFNRLPTNQDKNIISLFHPKRLLEIMKYFLLYDKNEKKIARYQQFFAVREIIKRVQKRDDDGNRRSGVIWHTQGSGKSLTMVMFAKYVLSQLFEYNPKVIVVTDRVNLDKQINDTFNHTRLRASRATTGRHLIELIADNKADVITTLVHKFDTASREDALVTSRDIFVLVDESHRTQYGELHIRMKSVFPNACYLGFTGTPLMKAEKNTMIKFGDLIHTYTIADGVRDKIIVPLLYEGHMVEQTVNRKAIDARLEMITRRLNEKQKEEVMHKWSQFEKIASSDQRLAWIAFKINEHFMNNYKTKGSQFKAMLAVYSRPEAIRYLQHFEELGDLKAAVVISPPDQREGYEAVDEVSQDLLRQFWQKMMAKYGDEETYEETIRDEFVNGDELDLVIVVDKLLTGFDAPRATVMYVDKPMGEHTLLQAIARVNRIYEGKDFGYIIDYRGLLQRLDEAMEMYAGGGLENFDPQDLKGALYDVISIIGSLRQHYTDLVNMFLSVTNKKDREEYELLLAVEKQRKQFYETLSKFGRYLKIALESERVYNSLATDELERYKRDFRFFQDLRQSVKIRFSDTIDHKEYEPQMQKLMDNYIAAEGVIRITNPVDILDEKGFAQELQRLGSPRSKADAIRTRLARSISLRRDENPLYYKKFSERIEETLQAYKEKRISEKEYLARMDEIKVSYQEGSAGIEYPSLIKSKPNAQAFYGVAVEGFAEARANYDVDASVVNHEQLAELALQIEEIVGEHTKVDWHQNRDVHNRIEQELEDLLFDFAEKRGLKLSLQQVDQILNDATKVALRRY